MNKIEEPSQDPNEIDEVKENIEVWEDLVNIKELVLALVICSVTTLGGYFIAPNEPPKPLFFGLIGALVGFIGSSILIKPKRRFRVVKDEA
ncbi:hypothetical protein FITA111629_00325 [Filibacter tadaridae]|uniref:Heme ABC transporter n=1 Tax=Filibacter tadaridae TaxID=2483811 RepID=A0A3P5XC92_9BACL|nr:hypothetical protein [Filibacter tadaridae]VDC28942.1 hypothetical protein FILTAD_01914 [Filibacter tadaridae]